MGTTVFTGRGLMKVTATGKSTELGKIAESLTEMKEEPTTLQVRLHRFSSLLTYIVISISVLFLIIGVAFGFGFLKMLETSIVLAIAAILEGLLIAVTMILVIGMRSILRRKGLVKRLSAVETLGSVTVICTDKTGTLTEEVMQVIQTEFKSDQMASYVMALCNNQADPLEATLWNCVNTMGYNPDVLSVRYSRIHEVPFSSEKKYMLTVNNIEGTNIALLKGAPDIILEFCKLTSEEKEEINLKLEDWAGSGLKLLGLAYKPSGNFHELHDFSWLGIVGIEDPIRPSLKDAIVLCSKAGIKVKIVTGDYRKTSEKITTSIGLKVSPSQILEGKEIEAMTPSQLADAVEKTVIFCRVLPHQKLRIVTPLQSRGEVVAMIGDGVNDAPALKKSNIGVSVGNGTDVAKEAASLILLDNNFETLVDTVDEGRIIFENIKKVVAYVLSNSFAEIFTIFGAILLGWPAPLSVAQILWIHLICDGPSDIVLGFERNEDDLMDEPPKSLKEDILDTSGKILSVSISFLSAFISLLLFWYFWKIGNDIASGRTIVFTILAIQSLVYVFSYRSLRRSIFRLNNFFSNRPLFGVVALGFIQQFSVLYVPFLNNVLGVVPLHLSDWVLVLGVPFLMMFMVEVVKYVAMHNGHNKNDIEHKQKVLANLPT